MGSLNNPRPAPALDLDRRDLLNLAMVMNEAARAAYLDERLNVAVTHHRLAGRLWASAGYDESATFHRVAADEIEQEIAKLARTVDVVAKRQSAA